MNSIRLRPGLEPMTFRSTSRPAVNVLSCYVDQQLIEFKVEYSRYVIGYIPESWCKSYNVIRFSLDNISKISFSNTKKSFYENLIWTLNNLAKWGKIQTNLPTSTLDPLLESSDKKLIIFTAVLFISSSSMKCFQRVELYIKIQYYMLYINNLTVLQTLFLVYVFK